MCIIDSSCTYEHADADLWFARFRLRQNGKKCFLKQICTNTVNTDYDLRAFKT